MKTRILLIDDEDLIRWSLKDSLEKAGYEILEADSGEAGLEIIKTKNIPLIILDMVLPGENGLNILKKIKRIDDRIQVIMITAFGSIETAVETIKCGAYDYLTKPFNLDEIVLKVERAANNAGLITELDRFKKIQENSLAKDQIIYKSRIMQEIMGKINKICEADIDIILLTGETGTGKGLIARTIHRTCSDDRGPFVTLNCTAIPDNLLESELFGYERGAFTDAKERREGVVEQAIGGTLLLDEIGDIPYKLQGKLLRFIEEKRIRRLGGRKEIEVNLKLIAATNKDLQKAMESGEFRPDLYHRLNLIQLHLPPLRERKEDIAPLANYFLSQFGKKYNRKTEGFTGAAHTLLTDYSWPGNIRELSNIVERACILENAELIDRSQIIGYLIERPSESANQISHIDLQDNISFEQLLSDYKKFILKTALEKCNYNRARAAKLLNMDRSTFKYQMKMVNL